MRLLKSQGQALMTGLSRGAAIGSDLIKDATYKKEFKDVLQDLAYKDWLRQSGRVDSDEARAEYTKIAAPAAQTGQPAQPVQPIQTSQTTQTSVPEDTWQMPDIASFNTMKGG
jgi:hypothetical protein